MTALRWSRLLIGTAALTIFVTQESRGEQYCHPCLEQALAQNGEGTLKYLGDLVAKYRAIAPKLNAYERNGTPAQREAASKFLATWRAAKQWASVYRNHEYVQFLQDEKQWRAERVKQIEAELVRCTSLQTRFSKSQLDPVRQSALDPERQSAIHEVESFAQESHQLSETFYRDLGLSGLKAISAAHELAVGAALEAVTGVASASPGQGTSALLATLEREEKIVRVLLPGTVEGAEQAHNVEAFRNALDAKDRRGQALAAVGAASGALLFSMEHLVQTPSSVTPIVNGALKRASLYVSVVALTLDNVLVENALSRLSDADQRVLDVNSNVAEARMQAQVKIKVYELKAAKEYLHLVDNDIMYQQRVAAFARSVDEWGK